VRLERTPFRPATGGIGRLDPVLDVGNARSGKLGVDRVVGWIARCVYVTAAGAPLTGYENRTEHGI